MQCSVEFSFLLRLVADLATTFWAKEFSLAANNNFELIGMLRMWLTQWNLDASTRKNRRTSTSRGRSRSLESLEARRVLDSTVVFNEIMYNPAEVANESLEWIELYNQLAVDMDVSDWSLRGGVDFTFPAGTIVPGHGYVVVAADPDLLQAETGFANAAGPLEGRLDNNGETLKLFNNDNRVMNEVDYSDGGQWPVGPDGSGFTLAKYNQRTASHDAANWTTSLQESGTPGAANFFEEGSINRTTLMGSGVPVTAMIPTDGSLGLTWTEVGFDDASWTTGTTGVGYERNSGYEPFLGLDLDDPPGNQPAIPLRDNNESAYIRVPFEITTELSQFDSVVLRMKYDDGFVAYINGQEVARGNAPDNVTWNSGANGSRSDGQASQFADFDITGFLGNLNQDGNVLAIHGLNQSLTSSDFLISPEIVGVQEIKPGGPDDAIAALAINEVEASDEDNFWIELANDGETPVNLQGFSIRATGTTGGHFEFGNNLIPVGGFLQLTDNELGFHPDAGERLFLFSPDNEQLLDARQVTNRLRGRSEAHDQDWLFPTQPTPGAANVVDANSDIVINEILYHAYPTLSKPGTPATFETTTILPIDATWRYNESGENLGTNWNQETHEVDNQKWFSGRGLFGFENETLPDSIRSEFTDPNDNDPRITTYYFESEFTIPADTANTEYVLRHVVDDGVIIYINGNELIRFNMSEGNVDGTTLASATVNEAAYSSPITIPANMMQAGVNTISAELHQGSNSSSDIVFGAEIEARGELIAATPSIPFAESDEEWIELFNRGSQPADVGNWRFDDAIDFTFEQGTVIPPGEYLVVARDADAFSAKYPDVTAVGSFSGSLANSEDNIVLVDANRNTVDEVHYFERGTWASDADGGGSSLELRNPFADNSHGAAWAASDESDKSEWKHYSVTRRTGSDLVGAQYNEFIFGLLDSGEFLLDDVSVKQGNTELIQNGTFSSDGLGTSPDTWRLIGNHSGEVVRDPDDADNRVLHVVAAGAQAHVHDHAETTFAGNRPIRNNVDYTISFRAKWIAGNSQFNNRLYFTRAGNTIELDVPRTHGTPGAQNTSFESNIGPSLEGLRHSPVLPSVNQAVTVDIHAEDPNGVADVKLWWNTNGGAWNSVDMTDLGDGDYRASVPGQSRGRVVQFYIEAIDGNGASATFPAEGRDSRALYEVNTGASTSLPIDTLRIVMLPGDESELFSQVNRMSNHYRGATLVHNNGDVYYDIEVRQVGSRFIRPNSGYKVRLSPEQRFYGVHDSIRFDINGLKEVVYKQMINRAGGSSVSLYDDIAYLISPNTGHNGTMLLNLARFEDVFLNEQFENGGDGTKWELDDVTYPTDPNPSPEGLKRGTGVTSPDIQDRGTDPEKYRGHLLIKNNRTKDDYDRIVEMAQAINENGNALFDATNEVMDVDLWMRHYATQSFLGNWDTYGFRRPKNLRIYTRPSDQKIIPLAWDFDLANLTEPLIYNGGPTRLDDIRNIPANTRLFWGHMWDLVNNGFNDEYIGRWASHYGSLTGSNYGGETSKVRSRETEARSEARNAIPQVDFNITTNGGRDLSANQNSVALRGTGWIDVRSIRWQEGDATLDTVWRTTDDWEIEVPVQLGDNVITLQAIGFDGQVIATDSINVTSNISNAVADSLRITEINYNPFSPTAEELAINPGLDNDDFEFIELQNVGSETINLLQSRFTSGIEFVFPSIDLDKGDVGVLVRNLEAFQLRYGDDVNVVGEYSGGLSNSGERVAIADAAGISVVNISYDEDGLWPESADGLGATLVIRDAAQTPAEQFGKHYQWRSSTELGGAPGTANSDPIGVVINEVLAHTDPPLTLSDSIELFNTTDAAIDIGGWYLSDSRSLMKYRIANGTTLAAGGYLVLDEDDFNPTPLNPAPNDFALSGAHGDDVWLTILEPNGSVRAFVDEVHFGGTPNGESVGRVPNGQGRLAPMIAPTFGQANSSVRVGPLIISKINYSPETPSASAVAVDPTITSDELEFVEVHNPTDASIDLSDWRIRGGIDYEFDADVALGASQSLVIVPFNPAKNENAARVAAFRAHYNINAGVRLVGGYGGQLSNAGERVELQRPDSPPADEPNFIPHLVEDIVLYDSLTPWPNVAANGMSLVRASTGYGSAATNWRAASPSPGTFGETVDVDFNADGNINVADIDLLCNGVRGGDPRFDVTGDATVNHDDLLFVIVNVLGTSAGDSNLDGKFDSQDLVVIFQAGQYEDGVAGNSNWSTGDWNCDGEFGSTDLVVAFQAATYTAATREPVSPSGAIDVEHAETTHQDPADSEGLTMAPSLERHTRLLADVAVDSVFARTFDEYEGDGWDDSEDDIEVI
ncbi:lamin tail domain-containing protein [Planctomycetota bacterium]